MNDDLISRSALLADLREKGFLPAIVQRSIERAPAVDAVPVVRCRECKHRYTDSWCEYADDDDNFYCARGKRKDGAENG